ncbi:kelch-like protein 17 [Stylophora pistillata]|uniref:kelch-like protein 17 n=1 Tax=Stylophora pistillata TaxID=50429 RepID=UPI000C03BF43|nr:kelch-like protein 17 [Stylophora pistillata]
MNLSDQAESESPKTVSVIVQDGKEFKTHRHVLSEASHFFEKLLTSNMKENNEGVIRLEYFTESLMKDVLEFIHTGNVCISTGGNAAELIAAADYLCLSKLKSFAGKFIEQTMSSSNCVSTYFMAEKFYHSELLDSARKFILSNFARVAQTKNFPRLPSHEVEQLVSSDDVVINSEEDVFKAIIKWTIHKKSERSKEFCNLFRHVRLTLLSRDFLLNDVVTNEIVTGSEECLGSATHALAWMDRAAYGDLSRSFPPRKALEKCVIAICRKHEPLENPLFYLPKKGDIFRLQGMAKTDCVPEHVFSCRGKLFFISKEIDKSQYYDPDFNCWHAAPWTKTDSEINWLHWRVMGRPVRRKVVVVQNEICFIEEDLDEVSSCLWKFNLDTNSTSCTKDWLETTRICAVTVGKYIYVIGGARDINIIAQCSKFDAAENKWEKLANLNMARFDALGVGTQEKIYVAGGWLDFDECTNTCEVYYEFTDEWHSMGRLTVFRPFGNMVLIDNSLYALGGALHEFFGNVWSIEGYDHEKDEWIEKERTLFVENITQYKASSFTYLKNGSIKLKRYKGIFQ